MKKEFLKIFVVALFLICATVACNKNVTGVILEPAALELAVDETATLTATVQPANATNIAVVWTSSNTEIAAVSNGTVTAKSAGTATITVTTQDGGFSAECVVTVTQSETGIVINGVKWATRNLASHGKFVEKPEDYGALFQWGRKGDGHEQRTSQNYPTNDNSQEAGVVSGAGLDANGQIVSGHAAYGKFIKQNETPYDWCSPQNDVLWNSGTEAAPIKTANDPCPAGWRVPTHAELQSLIDSGSEWDDLNGISGRYFGDGATKLFLPAAGVRSHSTGEVLSSGEYGDYWSSTVDDIYARYLRFGDGYVGVYYSRRAFGFSVRCVADL